MKTTLKTLTVARRAFVMALGGIAFSAAMGATANANSDHWDKFSCYAYVHDQCYANGENNCSSEDYNWGLGECDGYYPSSAGVKRPKGVKSLAAATNSRQTKAIILRSFKK